MLLLHYCTLTIFLVMLMIFGRRVLSFILRESFFLSTVGTVINPETQVIIKNGPESNQPNNRRIKDEESKKESNAMKSTQKPM